MSPPNEGDDGFYTRIFFRNPRDAHTVSYGSKFKKWFAHHVRGAEDHEWFCVPRHVLVSGYGCAICSHHQIQAGVNDLFTTAREFTCMPDREDPAYTRRVFFCPLEQAKHFMRGSTRVATFGHLTKEHELHTWPSMVGNVICHGSGCPRCCVGQSEVFFRATMSRVLGPMDAAWKFTIDGIRHEFDYINGGPEGVAAECDGDHHFPHKVNLYGGTVKRTFENQHARDVIRNSFVRLMIRVPTPEVHPKMHRRVFETMVEEIAEVAVRARAAGEVGLILHPRSRAAYERAYTKEEVAAAIVRYERHSPSGPRAILIAAFTKAMGTPDVLAPGSNREDIGFAYARGRVMVQCHDSAHFALSLEDRLQQESDEVIATQLAARMPTPDMFVPPISRAQFEEMCALLARKVAKGLRLGLRGVMRHPLARAVYMRGREKVVGEKRKHEGD